MIGAGSNQSIILLTLSLILVFSLVSESARSSDQAYDLVISNGRVVDPETGFDQIANIGVRNGFIDRITSEQLQGARSIDATGLVVSAGFIDTHFHALDDLAVKMAMRDGVTTGMDLEWGALDVAQWYQQKQGRWPINYGTSVSHEGARMIVHDGLMVDGPRDATQAFEMRNEAAEDGIDGWSVTRSSNAQMNQIMRLLDEGLQQGALGVGSTVGYMRTGVTTYEMFEAQRTAARYGRLTAVHARFHPSSQTPVEAQMGFAEVFTNAMLLEAPLLYQHNNDYGWWEIEEKLQLARSHGLNMWSEYYPYAAGSTAIGAEFIRPSSWEAMGYRYEETVYDPDQDKFLSKREYLEMAEKEPGHIIVLFIPPRKEWMAHWLRVPHMTVGADSMISGLGWDAEYSEYAGHPRTAGTHARVLKMAREHGVSLMHTLSQLSYWPAMHLAKAGVQAMAVRGRMQEGMVADITIFDPETVSDNASYRAGEQGRPSTGIPWVIVNGRVVVADSKAQWIMAGQPIRFPVESKGRHQPVTKEVWLRLETE